MAIFSSIFELESRLVDSCAWQERGTSAIQVYKLLNVEINASSCVGADGVSNHRGSCAAVSALAPHFSYIPFFKAVPYRERTIKALLCDYVCSHCDFWRTPTLHAQLRLPLKFLSNLNQPESFLIPQNLILLRLGILIAGYRASIGTLGTCTLAILATIHRKRSSYYLRQVSLV